MRGQSPERNRTERTEVNEPLAEYHIELRNVKCGAIDVGLYSQLKKV